MRITSLMIDNAPSAGRTRPHRLDGRDPQMNRISLKSAVVVVAMAMMSTLLIISTVDIGADRRIVKIYDPAAQHSPGNER
jgi:hypothetical protein